MAHRADMRQSPSKLERFFFSEEIPYGIALTRIFLPLILMITCCVRWIHTRDLYSTDGATAPLSYSYGMDFYLPEFSGSIAVAVHTALILALFASMIGWQTRLSLIVASVLYYYIPMLDVLSTLTKYTVIGSHALLILAVSNCGAVWSVDSWLAGRWRRNYWPGSPPVSWQRCEVWPQRLMQLMVGIVYLGAAMTKIHTPTFFTGDQLLYWLMTYVNFRHPVGDYMAHFPGLLVVSGYVTIVWEVLFLFCAWKGWGRILCVALGVIFHLMTTLTLGLIVFPLIMMAIYLSFLTEEDVQWLSQRGRWFRRRFVRLLVPTRVRQLSLSWGSWRLPEVRVAPQYSLASFALASALLIMVGVEIEYRYDYYGERRPEGRYALTEISPQLVAAMTTPTPPLREADKFLSFDIGTSIVGGRLWDRKTEFRHGERLICEANLNPPHADMWVECNLHDEANHVLIRNGLPIPRESFRGHFQFEVPDSLDPGRYFMVLRTRGKEVMRKTLIVKAGPRTGAPISEEADDAVEALAELPSPIAN